jgi:hypothetical protein
MIVKTGEKFASRASGKKIRVVGTYGDMAIIVNLKRNGHRDVTTNRAVNVDSIRRKYQKV